MQKKFLQRPEPLTGSRLRRDARHGPSTSGDNAELQPLRGGAGAVSLDHSHSNGYNPAGVLDPPLSTALLSARDPFSSNSGGYVAPVITTASNSNLSSAAGGGGGNSVDVQRQIDAIIAGISDPELRDNVQGLLIARNRLDMGNIIGRCSFNRDQMGEWYVNSMCVVEAGNYLCGYHVRVYDNLD